MIITRTPFRISFFGGGSDYPVWYKEHGGAVISTTINKYCYLNVRRLPPFFPFKHRFRYYKTEEVNKVDEIQHSSIRECLKFVGFNDGTEIVHNADLPAQSGLGSSSTFTVGLLNALYGLKSYMPTKKELALNAIHVEQNLIQEAVGSQDQTAASFGGLNKITFSGGKNEIEVQPIILSQERYSLLENNLMLFFTGYARNAFEIAVAQIKASPKNANKLNAMMGLVDEAFSILLDGNRHLNDFGQLLGKQWGIKRTITNKITTNEINDIYKTGIKAGALGGKLLGAGGGGFILFYAEPHVQPKIREKLSYLTYVPFKFDNTGSQVIYHTHENHN
jgi:D-glycero-alpha-D-manno-heptose-7-phosphate kinase